MDDQRLDRFFRRLRVRDSLRQAERDALSKAAGPTLHFAPGELMAHYGSSPSKSLLLIQGMAARQNTVESGQQQITAFHIAGDFVDLHAFLLSRLDHDVSAMSAVAAVEFSHEALRQITEEFPHLTRLLWLSTLLDGAIHRQWLVAMGRLTAIAHMAHLFCEHFVRADSVGLAQDMSFPFEITQQELADALGLSNVHVNRTLQELRRQDLVSWDTKTVRIIDWERLQEVAQFDPIFLDVVHTPR
ncbi:MAG: Crp/Fnr family transcriptional regulator [Devosia sp.]|jgi:CRP-like cAMP-binding protein|nr:Crp/Fnr family transcriptional regulator [Devosia sp.]